MRPTFASFYVASAGLNAARARLSITGQNMVNADTPGYTRQRVDTSSIGSSGLNMRYVLQGAANLGEGVRVDGTSQFRDPYLDVHYRREYSKFGNTTTKLDAMNELESILDETMDEGLIAQFSDLKKQIQNLTGNPGDAVSEKIVQTSASMLLKTFNQVADQLKLARTKQFDTFKDSSVGKTNQLLENISNLNKQIKTAQVGGSPALELLDQRNSMIDELSGYMKIEVVTKTIDIGSGASADELNISLVADGGERIRLVSDDEYKKFNVTSDSNGKTILKLYDSNDKIPETPDTFDRGVLMNDKLTTGALLGHLETLNHSGEFDATTVYRGVGFYEQSIDKLANQFAKLFNEANSIEVNPGPPPIYDKPLFATSDGSDTITASNISLSEKWMNSTDPYITNVKTTGDNVSATDNLEYMLSLFDKDITFVADSGTPLFKGPLQKYFSNISTTLGIEMESMNRQSVSFASTLKDIETQIQSISGVNVDEEGINLIMFNQALTASSRFMTTLDEALDTIINKMGIVGR